MVVLPRVYAERRTIMPDRKTETPRVFRQLRLYLSPIPAPLLEDAQRAAVVQLLARLLTSACAAETEGRDEPR